MKPPPPAFVPPRDTASVLRREGMFRRLAQRARASAELVLPAVPSLCDHYADLLADHFAALGRPFSATELAQLHGLLLGKLQEAFAISPYSNIVVRYSTAAGLRIDYGVAAAPSSIAEEYAYWTQTREPPLFGKEPDARVVAAIRDLGLPASASCLDVGAGTGRNALPLARRGMKVTAIEPASALAEKLEADAAAEALSVRVIVADALASPCPIDAGSFSFAFASQVTSHFRGPAELGALFRLFAAALAPGGHALATVFVTAPDFAPDRLSREVGQLFWSTFFTAAEVDEALAGLPLARVSSEPTLAYERAHQPRESWPPTSWFEGWASGEDIFGKLPRPSVTLEWLLLRRTAGAAP